MQLFQNSSTADTTKYKWVEIVGCVTFERQYSCLIENILLEKDLFIIPQYAYPTDMWIVLSMRGEKILSELASVECFEDTDKTDQMSVLI